eukprot:TRINITY_DN18284_c0_g1_i1.p1 TRINITY_DN18284_c0_g1~~TRINITY_DN18284_c0_g1_i1.p1  ORF type:complete len:178 (-),score=31.06 TRINITY_DN18284_c0_g1_i1:251-784(-)
MSSAGESGSWVLRAALSGEVAAVQAFDDDSVRSLRARLGAVLGVHPARLLLTYADRPVRLEQTLGALLANKAEKDTQGTDGGASPADGRAERTLGYVVRPLDQDVLATLEAGAREWCERPNIAVAHEFDKLLEDELEIHVEIACVPFLYVTRVGGAESCVDQALATLDKESGAVLVL